MIDSKRYPMLAQLVLSAESLPEEMRKQLESFDADDLDESKLALRMNLLTKAIEKANNDPMTADEELERLEQDRKKLLREYMGYVQRTNTALS